MEKAKAYEIIKQLRIEKGISQKDLADKVGLTQQAIALLENGKRKLEFDLFIEILNKIGTTTTELKDVIHSIFSQPSEEEVNLDIFELYISYLKNIGCEINIHVNSQNQLVYSIEYKEKITDLSYEEIHSLSCDAREYIQFKLQQLVNLKNQTSNKNEED